MQGRENKMPLAEQDQTWPFMTMAFRHRTRKPTGGALLGGEIARADSNADSNGDSGRKITEELPEMLIPVHHVNVSIDKVAAGMGAWTGRLWRRWHWQY